jgi:hypothetical protein
MKCKKNYIEKAINKFVINNKMCSKEYLNPAKHQKKSISQDLRKKKVDHQKNVHDQFGKKASTKEPELIGD